MKLRLEKVWSKRPGDLLKKPSDWCAIYIPLLKYTERFTIPGFRLPLEPLASASISPLLFSFEESDLRGGSNPRSR